MKEILSRIDEFEYITTTIFPEDIILNVNVIKISFLSLFFNFIFLILSLPLRNGQDAIVWLPFIPKGFP